MKKIIYTFALLLFINFDVSAQCYPDRHTTNFSSSWLSCTATASPNPARGVSHWIQFELDMIMEIGQFHFWNYNHHIDNKQGIQNYIIDYSTDGTNWTEFGQFVLANADGDSYYEGVQGPDMGDLEAKYILITALDNYEGPCIGLSEIKVFVQESSVPLELVKFDLDCKGNHTMVKWSITNSLNQEAMVLERSEDAKKWEEIYSELPAGLNQHEVYEYEYLDEQASFGTHYYRLKMIDYDGSVEYSPILESNCKAPQLKMDAYPVPSSQWVTIDFVSEDTGDLNYEVLDLMGRVVFSGKKELKGFELSFDVDIGDLPVGTYTLILNQNGHTAQKKIVRIKD